MEDQNQTTPQANPENPTQVVDVVTQPKPVEPTATPVAAPDPELVSEPSVEPAPAQGPVEAPEETAAPQPDKAADAQNASVDVAQPVKPKQPSTVPVGPIIVAIIIFIVLAAVTLVAFRQGF